MGKLTLADIKKISASTKNHKPVEIKIPKSQLKYDRIHIARKRLEELEKEIEKL